MLSRAVMLTQPQTLTSSNRTRYRKRLRGRCEARRFRVSSLGFQAFRRYRINCFTRSYMLNSNQRFCKLNTYSFSPIQRSRVPLDSFVQVVSAIHTLELDLHSESLARIEQIGSCKAINTVGTYQKSLDFGTYIDYIILRLFWDFPIFESRLSTKAFPPCRATDNLDVVSLK
jgi:hypothetical protein